MTDLDSFASVLFDEAKRFLEKAQGETDVNAKSAYLHAALSLSFSSLEAHVNAISAEFMNVPDLTVHEHGVLLERPVELEHGLFKLNNRLKMYRLEDRLLFLCARFSVKPIDREAPYWSELKDALRLRHSLTHPKTPTPTITEKGVERALSAVLEVLNEVYKRIYKKKYPAHGRGLLSNFAF